MVLDIWMNQDSWQSQVLSLHPSPFAKIISSCILLCAAGIKMVVFCSSAPASFQVAFLPSLLSLTTRALTPLTSIVSLLSLLPSFLPYFQSQKPSDNDIPLPMFTFHMHLLCRSVFGGEVSKALLLPFSFIRKICSESRPHTFQGPFVTAFKHVLIQLLWLSQLTASW